MTIEQRIKYFDFIRDIPYHIALNGEHDYCCSTKSIMLGHLLESLSLKTRQVICTFDWNDTPFPKEILSLPFDKNETTHQYLQVFIPERQVWANIDPTWDAPLRKLGFGIETWDGLSNTDIAVNQIHVLSEDETQKEIERFSQPSAVKEFMEYHRAFFQAINRYFVQARISS